jgi:TetR/AcrR family transcriptional repressor of nem operon
MVLGSPGKGGELAMSDRHPSRVKLLEASLRVMRAKGYNATRVEDLCEAAGVTKGSFFHHFKSKEEIGIAAAEYWAETTGELFANAPYHRHADPLDRVLAYVDFRKQLLAGELPQITCLAGTLVQEIFDSDPKIRAACERCIRGHARTLEADIAEAMKQRGVEADWTPAGLALHTQAVVQGALLLAKATSDTQVAADSLDHLRRYIELLFTQREPTAAPSGDHGTNKARRRK